MNFTKMHGIGNDFILVDGIRETYDHDWHDVAKLLCDRHFGIGADGLIVAEISEKDDIRMRIYNADGSEAEMCGNGIRCFAYFVMLEELVTKKTFSVETGAGTMIPTVLEQKGSDALVRINMGKPFLDTPDIPVDGDAILSNTGVAPSKSTYQGHFFLTDIPIQIDSSTMMFTPVGMGNPHVVTFVDDVASVDVSAIGPKIESHAYFPNRTNVEFVEIKSRTEVQMRVWERGSSETLACGTGACASVVAGILRGDLDDVVAVHLEGGNLSIDWSDDHLFMTGPTSVVFLGGVSL